MFLFVYLCSCSSLLASGTYLAVGGHDGRLVIWDFYTKSVVKLLIGHVRPVTSLRSGPLLFPSKSLLSYTPLKAITFSCRLFVIVLVISFLSSSVVGHTMVGTSPRLRGTAFCVCGTCTHRISWLPRPLTRCSSIAKFTKATSTYLSHLSPSHYPLILPFRLYMARLQYS